MKTCQNSEMSQYISLTEIKGYIEKELFKNGFVVYGDNFFRIYTIVCDRLTPIKNTAKSGKTHFFYEESQIRGMTKFIIKNEEKKLKKIKKAQ